MSRTRADVDPIISKFSFDEINLATESLEESKDDEDKMFQTCRLIPLQHLIDGTRDSEIDSLVRGLNVHPKTRITAKNLCVKPESANTKKPETNTISGGTKIGIAIPDKPHEPLPAQPVVMDQPAVDKQSLAQKKKHGFNP